jgi:hypothetical protein
MAVAWRANRRTSLVFAVSWAAAAWFAWAATAWWEAVNEQVWPIGRYLTLTLTGCAGIAVLGARRPGAGAWNLVVAGLGAILLRPLLEGLGGLRLKGPHCLFLAATLAVPLVNYLPTRLAVGALALIAAFLFQVPPILGSKYADAGIGSTLAGFAPWLGWLGLALRRNHGDFNCLWLSFRDRFGFLWGQRLREQFNQAAANAGWPLRLAWGGLWSMHGEMTPAESQEALVMLKAALKRFRPDQ